MIEGALNFRDVGGVRTRDGRVLRSGRVFRCGALDAVTEAGLAQLSALGLTVYFDLRSNIERQVKPARLPEVNAPRVVFRDHDRLTGSLYHELAQAGDGAGLARRRMLALYEELPYVHRQSYRMLFDELLGAPGAPLAFGCAAGKDRTGVGALLLLTALGVGDEDIERDYLASAGHFDALAEVFFVGPRGAMRQADRVRWEPILRTDADYLAAARRAIAHRNGSVEGYLQAELGIGPGEVDTLRAALLS